MSRNLTTEEFIYRARLKHGDKYDYSKVIYKNFSTKVCVICPIHGEFWITPAHHLYGTGCAKCAGVNKRTIDEFISQAREVHGNKYDYSKAKYINSKTKICIICPEHGEFWQTPNEHLLGHNCPKCAAIKRGNLERSSTEEFIRKAIEIHGDYYDYSKVIYVNNRTKVCIICPIHGEFLQRPSDHLQGKGCIKCRIEKTRQINQSNTEEFVAKARLVHGDKFDYTPTKYTKSNEKVCIICPIHGEFWQEANNHLRGAGCPKCGKEDVASKQSMPFDEFVTRAIQTHGTKFDYSKGEYVNANTPIVIVCPIHGEFTQRPADHIRGNGCPKCAIEKRAESNRYTTEEFIKKAHEVHGNKYGYELVDYKGCYDPVKIICPKHGEFIQQPYCHLQGQGCPHCSRSIGEEYISKWLEGNNIAYISQHWIIPTQVLFGRNKFMVDFYLPDSNTIIEYHGRQHYERIDYFHKSEEDFAEQQDRDRRLRKHCKRCGINLIEIPYTEFDNIDKILSKKFKVKS